MAIAGRRSSISDRADCPSLSVLKKPYVKGEHMLLRRTVTGLFSVVLTLSLINQGRTDEPSKVDEGALWMRLAPQLN